MNDRIIEWMRTGMTPEQMGVQAAVLLALVCVVGWLVYRVVIADFIQEWRRLHNVGKKNPAAVGTAAEQPMKGQKI